MVPPTMPYWTTIDHLSVNYICYREPTLYLSEEDGYWGFSNLPADEDGAWRQDSDGYVGISEDPNDFTSRTREISRSVALVEIPTESP